MVFPEQQRMRCSCLAGLEKNGGAQLCFRMDVDTLGASQCVFSEGPNLSTILGLPFNVVFFHLSQGHLPSSISPVDDWWQNPPQWQQDKITRDGTVLRWSYGCAVIQSKETWLPVSLYCLCLNRDSYWLNKGHFQRAGSMLGKHLVTQQKQKNKTKVTSEVSGNR